MSNPVGRASPGLSWHKSEPAAATSRNATHRRCCVCFCTKPHLSPRLSTTAPIQQFLSYLWRSQSLNERGWCLYPRVGHPLSRLRS
ncbi:TPA: hypothetical protein ACH3X1_005283 [Trebouxia sp. C0004]